MNAHPSLVSGFVAEVASLGPVQGEIVRAGNAQLCKRFLAVTFRDFIEFRGGRMIGLLAVLAERPDEPLRENAQQGIREIQRIDPHVEEPDDGLRGAVRVQRAEDEVSRQGRLHADLGRLEIPHLADHDDIRVRPQE